VASLTDAISPAKASFAPGPRCPWISLDAARPYSASPANPMTIPGLQRLTLDDMDQVATVHRIAFDDRLPWLAGRHTPAEDRWFFRERVFRNCIVWGVLDPTLIGFIAFREGWIDQLYVRPQSQGQGIGQQLLQVAKAEWPSLKLWTFQRNTAAGRFYERQGFVALGRTDGSGNEEQEPDVLYRWDMEAGGPPATRS
jgi:putative acetyltransferase